MIERDNSQDPTPYAVYCMGHDYGVGIDPGCGLVFLTDEQYGQQLAMPNYTWRCSNCGHEASWDDDCRETNPPNDGMS